MSSQNNKIAFQGQRGAYSEAACNSSFPKMETLPCETFEDVFGAVMEGNAQLAMIPIENSQAGRVADIHNLLANSTLNIVGEHFQRVRHQLLGISGTTLDKIRTESSHAQAVSQCRNFINNKNLQPILVGDTAGAAAEIAKNNDPSASAIASKLAADIYKLKVLSHDIEDSENNVTRFVILSKNAVDPDPKKKVITSCIFKVRNIPAALYKALGGFATNRVNLLKLESYMIEGNFTSTQFYLDIAGHPSDDKVRLALEELGFFTREVKILGVYLADNKRKMD